VATAAEKSWTMRAESWRMEELKRTSPKQPVRATLRNCIARRRGRPPTRHRVRRRRHSNEVVNASRANKTVTAFRLHCAGRHGKFLAKELTLPWDIRVPPRA